MDDPIDVQDYPCANARVMNDRRKAKIKLMQLVVLEHLIEPSERLAANDPIRMAAMMAIEDDDKNHHHEPVTLEAREIWSGITEASHTNVRYDLGIIALCCCIWLVLILCMVHAVLFVYPSFHH